MLAMTRRCPEAAGEAPVGGAAGHDLLLRPRVTCRRSRHIGATGAAQDLDGGLRCCLAGGRAEASAQGCAAQRPPLLTSLSTALLC